MRASLSAKNAGLLFHQPLGETGGIGTHFRLSFDYGALDVGVEVRLDELTDQREITGTGNPSSVGVAVLVKQVVGERLIQGKVQSNIAKIDRGKVRASLVVVPGVLFEVVHCEVRVLREIPWIVTLLAD